MNADRLFDVPAVEVPVDEPLSADRRRTLRQRADLEAGRHPATGLPLLDRPNTTCGTCEHAHRYGWHKRSFWKCARHRLGESHCAASDIRVSWPACTSYEERRP